MRGNAKILSFLFVYHYTTWVSISAMNVYLHCFVVYKSIFPCLLFSFTLSTFLMAQHFNKKRLKKYGGGGVLL